MNRSYDSHGPDVRIRGNARHVAEKYLELARDAHVGNNPVAAESYLQHAEHYFRLIAAAQSLQARTLNGVVSDPSEADPDEIDNEPNDMPDRFASA